MQVVVPIAQDIYTYIHTYNIYVNIIYIYIYIIHILHIYIHKIVYNIYIYIYIYIYSNKHLESFFKTIWHGYNLINMTLKTMKSYISKYLNYGE